MMTGPVEGRWLIDFGGDGTTDAGGNEIVLGGGVVALAHAGKPIGRYEVKLGELTLTLTLPMPAIPGEGEWQMIARFALPADLSAETDLIGVMQGTIPGGPSDMYSCLLRRRLSQA
jgi:hypothetical protein